MANTVTVGIADLNVVKAPDTLVTYALGSCVGICLYDPDKKIAGLAHIMLPLSTEAAQGVNNKRRYADTGIAELIQKMTMLGANKARLTAKIAGGAQMFSVSSTVFNIGERNVAAVKKVLASYRIRIVAEETGANFGRTQYFHGDTGIMEIRAATRPTKMY
ncbi:MAG: chemotaxis protein CheD [Oscillospiraceae bacterium]|nr:chemotaxis protein CheD [Oscillospiraceae bacterium]MDE7279575.1 chemotaxis protein CheD [Oscillospiraceae bacterium]